jgi:hypothetical protein
MNRLGCIVVAAAAVCAATAIIGLAAAGATGAGATGAGGNSPALASTAIASAAPDSADAGDQSDAATPAPPWPHPPSAPSTRGATTGGATTGGATTGGVTTGGVTIGGVTIGGVTIAGAPIDGATPGERMAAFRRYSAIDFVPAREPRQIVMSYAAKIYTGEDVAATMAQWRKMAIDLYERSRKRLNPFEKIALIHGWMICRDKATFPPDLIDAMKKYVELYKHKRWIGYGALNYRLMNDGAGFIAAEQWPDLTDADGLDSDAIKSATKARLMGYFDHIVHDNADEYGAPTYLGIDLSAMKLLADRALDPEVKRHASLALDTMLLQVACAWNRGYYVTPASRSKYYGTSMTCPEHLDTTGAIAWLLFGGSRPVSPGGMNPPGSFWFAVPGDYRPPKIFADIAADRARSFVHMGSAGPRIRITIYHTPTYSLASEWELLPAPSDAHYKESRRQMLKWVSPAPDSTFFPFQENPRRPYALREHVANAFGYGENPFAQSLQEEGTLIGVSSVPLDYPYWKMQTPFTTAGAIVRRAEKSGWVFCHGGSALFAFRYAQTGYWAAHRARENCDVFESDSRKNGWVLETSPVAPFAEGLEDVGSGAGAAGVNARIDAELSRFEDAILSKTRLDVSEIAADHPRIIYHSLTGHELDLTWRAHNEPYAGQQKIDGKAVDYSAYPLLGDPWVDQPLGGNLLKIHHGSDGLTYDFGAWQTSQNAGSK